MEINEQKDKIQNQALEEWKKVGKTGTAEMITGVGKTFLALKALYTMPRHDQDTIHLFLAEQKDRMDDLIKDIAKFNKIYNCNVMQDYNLQFQCYQTVFKWKEHKFGLVIADEIHDSISPQYYKFFINNEFDAILGLTALFKENTCYVIKRQPELRYLFAKDSITKIEMLNKIAPIFFKYNINQGQIDKTSRKLNIYVVESELEKVIKGIKAGNIKKPFLQTEAASYSYLDKLFKTALNLIPYENEDIYDFEERKNLEIIKTSNKRSKFIYNLPSKIIILQKLLSEIDGKTIVFANSLEQLNRVIANVVSSKNTDEENTKIRERFDNGVCNVIGSFKKLKQGANLEKVDNCIIHSYFSTELDFIQRIGRLRQNEDKDGNVFILVTKNTQEEVWLKAMLQNVTDYDIVYCNIDECIKHIRHARK